MNKFKFNIDTYGPGIWYMIHLEAINATNDQLKTHFIKNINHLCLHFPCEKCKLSFKQFINDHSLIKYWDIKHNVYGDIGFFAWSWELHNMVNKKLNKPYLTFDDALAIYKNYICTDCNDTLKPNPFLLPHTIDKPSLILKPR